MHPPKVFYYLACPYSHKLPAVRALRVEQSRIIQAGLLENGIATYNPISHTHDLVKYLHGNPYGYDYWHKMDEAFLDACAGIIVCELPGWETSKGVLGELCYLQNTRGNFSMRWAYLRGGYSNELHPNVVQNYIDHIRDNLDRA